MSLGLRRIGIVGAVVLVARGLIAQETSDAAAALIVYPYIHVDSSAGIDTRIQLTNTYAAALRVRCFLEESRQQCSVTTTQRCTAGADCPNGQACVSAWSATEINVELTAHQPIGWYASSGLSSLPSAQNLGSIPAVAEDPFTGALRCLVVDEFGAPKPLNTLIGSASIESRVAGAHGYFDTAGYNAIGLPALSGDAGVIGEIELATNGEYSSPYNLHALQVMAEGVVDPIAGKSSSSTDLILLPTSIDYTIGVIPQTVVQIALYNEFEQLTSTSISISGQFVRDFSHVTSNSPTFSIFRAALLGTATAHLRLNTPGASGVLALALEHQVDMVDVTRSSSVMRGALGSGARSTPDRIVIAVTPAPTATPSETELPTETPSLTPTATRTGTPTPTATAAATASRTGTPSFSPTASRTSSASTTPTQSTTATRSATPTTSSTATATPSRTAAPSLSPTASRTSIASATPTESTTATRSATPMSSSTITTNLPASMTPTPSHTVSTTPSPSVTPTATVGLTSTASPTASETALPSASSSPTATSSTTATVTRPTATEAVTATASETTAHTPTVSPTMEPTLTPTTGRCACDCSNDGSVSGRELAVVIDDLLGGGAPICGAGNANGDNLLSVEDLVLCARADCSARALASPIANIAASPKS